MASVQKVFQNYCESEFQFEIRSPFWKCSMTKNSVPLTEYARQAEA
jgi:hypothetical protein